MTGVEFVQDVIWFTERVWLEEEEICQVWNQVPPDSRTPGNLYRAILRRRAAAAEGEEED